MASIWFISREIDSYALVIDSLLRKSVFICEISGIAKLSAISKDPTAEVVDLPTKSCTFSIDEKYVADNCSVVAVLVDTNTKEVIQAAEIALGEGSKH